MISEANIPNLLRCIKNNEAAHDFDFHFVFHPCGSYGCLLGNDVLAERSHCQIDVVCEQVDGIDMSDFAELEYGLSYDVSGWLFFESNSEEDTREQRIGRLRKFVYYVLHKRELLYDDSGCVRETARRAEGDHHIVRQVLAAAERRERELVR